MRNPELTKQLIIEKALPIFNTKGYNTTSISDITSATGITKGAIYGNFKNKDEVALAAFDEAAKLVMGKISKAIADKKNAPDKLIAMIDFYGDYVENPPIEGGCPIINSSVEADDNLPYLKLRIVRIITIMKESLIKIINRGIREDQLKADMDVEEFAVSFYAMLDGAILLSRIEGDMQSYKFVRKTMLKMVDEIRS